MSVWLVSGRSWSIVLSSLLSKIHQDFNGQDRSMLLPFGEERVSVARQNQLWHCMHEDHRGVAAWFWWGCGGIVGGGTCGRRVSGETYLNLQFLKRHFIGDVCLFLGGNDHNNTIRTITLAK